MSKSKTDVRRAGPDDLEAVCRLGALLFAGSSAGELRGEFAALLGRGDAAIYLYVYDGEPAAFAQCQLRRDYVEGTHASPVGYLEGIYVRPDLRRQGVARALLAACENWAGAQGCAAFASDCELGNEGSAAFHQRMGFKEANRIRCFVKSLAAGEGAGPSQKKKPLRRSLMQIYVKDSAEAVAQYRKAFDAELQCAYPGPRCGYLHAELDLGGQILAVSEAEGDGEPEPGGTMQFCLHFLPGEEDRVRGAFAALQPGSRVLHAPGPCDYSPCMADFIDRYGVRWCLFV
jgi:aminoglycoside 6'-N-acetyltransferase I